MTLDYFNCVSEFKLMIQTESLLSCCVCWLIVFGILSYIVPSNVKKLYQQPSFFKTEITPLASRNRISSINQMIFFYLDSLNDYESCWLCIETLKRFIPFDVCERKFYGLNWRVEEWVWSFWMIDRSIYISKDCKLLNFFIVVQN